MFSSAIKNPFSIILSLLALSFIFCSCSSVEFISQEEIKSKLDVKAFPTSEDYPESDAVVLYDNIELAYKLKSLNKSHVINIMSGLVSPTRSTVLNAILSMLKTEKTYYKVTKVFKNFDDYSSSTIYLGVNDKLKYAKARIIQPDGTIYELEDKDIIISTNTRKGSTKETKRLRFVFPTLTKNTIVEYTYKKVTTGMFAMSHWYLQEVDIPILYSQIKLSGTKNLLFEKAFVYDDISFPFSLYNS